MDLLPARARRLPWLTMVVALGTLVLLVTPAPAVRPVAYAPAAKPFCLVDTHIPDEAYRVEEFARTHNFSPPPGLRGGKTFQDFRARLPALLRPYREYDIYPTVPERGRPSPRVVLSDRVPYASWYTPDHYDAFLLMFPIDCVPNATTLLPRDVFGGGGS